MKRLLRNALTHPWVLPLAFPLTRGAAPVFMLHRFADPVTGRAGHDLETLRADLAWLRRNRFQVLPLDALLDRLRDGAPVHKTVALTVDDGYADFAVRAAPVFAEFDCPVTVFVVTGFLDGQCWLWWDTVEYLVRRADRGGVDVEAGAAVWSYRWRDGAERNRAVQDLVERLKLAPDPVRQDVLARLPALLGVDLPTRPTAEYAPMSWDAVRSCARSGVTFGPHTKTHPILSRVDDARAEQEIVESWRRVREAAGDAAVPVFCYPNGDTGSFGVRDQQLAARAGLSAAVSTVQAYASRRCFHPARPLGRFEVPRMPYVQDGASFVQVSAGLERAKGAVRSALGRQPA